MSLIDCANEDVWFGKKIKFWNYFRMAASRRVFLNLFQYAAHFALQRVDAHKMLLRQSDLNTILIFSRTCST